MYIPKFVITSAILKNVGLIEAAKEVIDTAPLVPAWEKRFRDEARLKIVHHGTHLEGNGLEIAEVERVMQNNEDVVVGRDRDVQEVMNYRNVMEYIDKIAEQSKESEVALTQEMLKEIHRLTAERVLPANEAGIFRAVKVVIRNTSTGEITFRPPPPIEVPYLIDDFFAWVQSSVGKSVHPLLRAGILHYELVRIHPFTDANGRMARAMALLLLMLEGYQVKKFFALEEYYDAHPNDYYEALKGVEIAEGDLTNWLEYFVLGIAIEFSRVKILVQKLSLDLRLKNTIGGKQIALNERQVKLVEFIERMGVLTMTEGRELLPDLSDDTVLRDLRDLTDKGLVVKKGKTKGVRYYLKN
ncbi:MAG: Fic family protein [bacterium]